MDVGIIDRPGRLPFSPEAQKTIIRHRNHLDREGYDHVSAAETLLMLGQGDLTAIVNAADSAPADPYDPYGLRRRFYRKGCYHPSAGQLVFYPPKYDRDNRPYAEYLQAERINMDANGRARRFSPLPDELENDETLQKLVRIIFEMLPGDLIDRRREQEVGLHLTRLYSGGRQRAAPSPYWLHTDGEPWTSIILIDHYNVGRGSAVNYVAERSCRGKQPQDCDRDDILATISMQTPFEMILVDDARVSHHVTGVHGADCNPGWRTSLLIDFSPLRPERTI